MIEVKDLSAGYGAGDVIHGVSFRAKGGESLCILGPNGCGKSTLLKSIARIIEYRGEVTLEGRNLSSFSRKDMAKKIALLAQNAQIYFPYTIWEAVSLGRYAYAEGFLKNLSAEDEAVIEDTLRKLDIWDIKDRMIDELSGGQLQRVFLAKTLAQNPEVILLDEPTNHLDLKNQIELLRYLKLWAAENNKTLIGVFHDLNLVHHFGDTALLMNDGKLAAWGGIEEALNGETMRAVYGMDIRGFMLESLKKWERGR
ncbi:MAG: ABC transporter ATP-binding protein [Treponema sp.]|jgi:iron complex transport system ATP-binding protein|nr:ABC transporter ATP-binding protein [Treponema sp.]